MAPVSEHVGGNVDHGLCCGCGTCIAVCTAGAIRMIETPSGHLAASVNQSICTGCGCCVRVCPGGRIETGLIPEDIDPFTGSCIAAYTAKAGDKTILEHAQSGGVVSALLCFLLSEGLVDRAVVTVMPHDGSLRPAPRIATTRQEVVEAQGSKYCPVALNAILPKLEDSTLARTAMVGLPCHVEGVRNAIAIRWYDDAPLLIGLVCDRVLTFGAINFLVEKAGLRLSDVMDFRYRDKAWRGWPGDVHVRTRNGVSHWVKRDWRMLAKDAFTPGRCRLCFDKANVLCDILAGDAWGFSEDVDGISVLVARTERGRDIIEGAAKAGALIVERADFRAIQQGQALDRKRAEWAAFTRARRTMGLSVPSYPIPPQYEVEPDVSMLARADYELRWADALRTAPTVLQAMKMARKRIRHERLRRSLKEIRSFRTWPRRAARVILKPVLARVLPKHFGKKAGRMD